MSDAGLVSKEERHRRYRAGLCVICGDSDHSAGRTRCENCHVVYTRGGERSD